MTFGPKRRALMGLAVGIGGIQLFSPVPAMAQAVVRPKTVVFVAPSGVLTEPERARASRVLAGQKEWRRAEFARHGLVEGRDYSERQVFAELEDEVLNERIAREVLDSRPDVIITRPPMVATFRRLTRDVPIVFRYVGDPEELGYVRNLRQPGGNMTGVISGDARQRLGLLVQLIRDIRPKAKRIALLDPYRHEGPSRRTPEILRQAAQDVGMEMLAVWQALDLAPEELLRALQATRADAFIAARLDATPDRARDPDWNTLQGRTGIPGFGLYNGDVRKGALACLGLNDTSMSQAIELAAQILRGASPSTLPVRQLTEYWVELNLKTAAAIGVDIPAAVIMRANHVVR